MFLANMEKRMEQKIGKKKLELFPRNIFTNLTTVHDNLNYKFVLLGSFRPDQSHGRSGVFAFFSVHKFL